MGTSAKMRRGLRGAWGLAGVVLASLGLSGCADFWETVTSRDFKVKALYSHPNPLVVLRDSKDGDERARALRALQEPRQHGGTDQEQDEIIKILTAAATTERQPLCRLAAIESLGRFQDPRAVQALKDAFYNAGSFVRDPVTAASLKDGLYLPTDPPPDLVTRIQCQALTALGQTGNAAAVELLVRVVREPRGEGDQENQQAMDRRIAAARALAKFDTPRATRALVEVLQNEKKDVALRDRAYESLQASTGKKLPPDAKAWNAILPPADQIPQLAEDSAPKPKPDAPAGQPVVPATYK